MIEQVKDRRGERAVARDERVYDDLAIGAMMVAPRNILRTRRSGALNHTHLEGRPSRQRSNDTVPVDDNRIARYGYKDTRQGDNREREHSGHPDVEGYEIHFHRASRLSESPRFKEGPTDAEARIR